MLALTCQGAHDAAAYDSWLREQVRASIDDPRPSLSDEQAREFPFARRALMIEASCPWPKVVTRNVADFAQFEVRVLNPLKLPKA